MQLEPGKIDAELVEAILYMAKERIDVGTIVQLVNLGPEMMSRLKVQTARPKNILTLIPQVVERRIRPKDIIDPKLVAALGVKDVDQLSLLKGIYRSHLSEPMRRIVLELFCQIENEGLFTSLCGSEGCSETIGEAVENLISRIFENMMVEREIQILERQNQILDGESPC